MLWHEDLCPWREKNRHGRARLVGWPQYLRALKERVGGLKEQHDTVYIIYFTACNIDFDVSKSCAKMLLNRLFA